MIQIVTIRQQILAALQRVYDSMGFDELLSADRIEKELLAAFHPTAVATTLTDGFDETALKLGYVKLEPGQIVVDAKTIAVPIGDYCSDCRRSQDDRCYADCKMQPIRAAIDASNKEDTK